MPAGVRSSDSRWTRIEDITLKASSATTATGTTTAVDVGDKGTLCLTLVVSARSGTSPTLDVTVQTSDDNSTWRTLGSAYAQQTNTNAGLRQSFPGCDRYARLSYVIGGTTPSFTWSVSGDAK